MDVTGFADRGMSYLMAAGLLPTLLYVRGHPPVVLYALSGRLACFYGEGDEGPFVVVVAAGRAGNVAVLGKVDPAELERAVVDCPDLDVDETRWVLADLRAARVEP